MLGRRVLRSKTWAGIAQEVYALLSAYQVLRIAIADATESTSGADPDRASFSVALQSARDQVIQAAGVIADTTIDLVGSPDAATDTTWIKDGGLGLAEPPGILDLYTFCPSRRVRHELDD